MKDEGYKKLESICAAVQGTISAGGILPIEPLTAAYTSRTNEDGFHLYP